MRSYQRPAISSQLGPADRWRLAAGRYPRFAGVDGGECTADVIKITWPSQVDDFKARLVPIAQGIDASVKACAGLSQADRDSWTGSFKAWSDFAARPTPFFGSSNEWETACSWARTFDAWRAKMQAVNCAVAGPAEIQTQQTNPVDLAKWVTYSIVGLSALVAIIVYAPELKAGLRALGRK